jgi:outer membrane protein
MSCCLERCEINSTGIDPSSRKQKMKKILIAAAVGMLVAGQVAAQESPWLVRARVVYIETVNQDSGTGLDLNVSNKTIPEVDISYFFNKNVAAELVLTVPQEQHVYTGAGAHVGTFTHLPPTLTAQYHFTNFNGYKPYIGAGVNFTKIGQEKLQAGTYNLSNNSVGAAFQVGVDIPLTKQVSLNFDVKKAYIKTHVYAASNGADAGILKIDPVLVGVGVGYRF